MATLEGKSFPLSSLPIYPTSYKVLAFVDFLLLSAMSVEILSLAM